MVRPHSLDPKDHTIPETRVEGKVYWMVRLKAALYTKGKVADLIRAAVAAYEAPVPVLKGPCPVCGKVPEPATEPMTVGDVTVLDVPSHRCGCGVLDNVRVAAAIEQAVSDLGLHGEVRFGDLLNAAGSETVEVTP